MCEFSSAVVDRANSKSVKTRVRRKAQPDGQLLVDYRRSIADSIKAGEYDVVDERVNDIAFASVELGRRRVDPELFPFRPGTLWAHVRTVMKEVRYRPATPKELLAFGEKRPDEQKDGPIVAIGVVKDIDGEFRACCLTCGHKGRYVTLRPEADDSGIYDGQPRFLGVAMDS